MKRTKMTKKKIRALEKNVEKYLGVKMLPVRPGLKDPQEILKRLRG